jgi:hypothetical protein
MSAPLPDALRARFQRCLEEGLSGRAAALRLKLSPATGARWALAIRRTGRAEAATQGRPKGKGKLDPYLGLFAEIIEQDGDITMPELSAALFAATRVRRLCGNSFDSDVGLSIQHLCWFSPAIVIFTVLRGCAGDWYGLRPAPVFSGSISRRTEPFTPSWPRSSPECP